jgi:uncharacterized phage-associated protein
MKSPITGKEMENKIEKRTFQFRKEDFEVYYHFYYCPDSGESFTDSDLDDLNTNQVKFKYCEKYGIPFKEEIIAIRQKYDISVSKISQILGLGKNVYYAYEEGEIPSVSNGRLILSISQPEEFIRQVNACEHLLSHTEINTIIFKAEKIALIEQENQFNNFSKPSEFSGYKKLDLNVVQEIIIHFSSSLQLFKTKLNKLLFFADFVSFKETGMSMTGLKYRAYPYGPVAVDIERILYNLQSENILEISEIPFPEGYIGEVFLPLTQRKNSILSKSQFKIIDRVIKKFATKTTTAISELSHLEDAWKENHESKDFISFPKYAYFMKTEI